MDKAQMIEKTTQFLTPFETENVIEFLRHQTVKSAMSNPWFVGVFAVIAFYAVIVRSKFVLSILFTATTVMILLRYTMPAEGDSLSVTSSLPFAFGGIAIGAFLIYLNFIKTE